MRNLNCTFVNTDNVNIHHANILLPVFKDNNSMRNVNHFEILLKDTYFALLVKLVITYNVDFSVNNLLFQFFTTKYIYYNVNLYNTNSLDQFSNGTCPTNIHPWDDN